MMDDFDFGDGISNKVIDLSFNKESKIEDLIDDLKEDLIHIEYVNGCLLDVGWYPEFQLDGCFKIVIVQNYNWEILILESACGTLDSLVNEIREGIQVIKNIK